MSAASTSTKRRSLDADLYAGTTHIGKTGIERYYEDELHGTPGYEQVEVNADKRVQREIERVAPTPGKNLYLSIDARLQRVAEDAFDGRAGAAVAIDPRNGEVLAMVSVPSFDRNLFVNGISRIDYARLIERCGQTVAQPRDRRQLPAGLDDEAVRRRGRARTGPAQATRYGRLDRRVSHSRTGARLPRRLSGRPRRHGDRDHRVGQYLFLYARARHGHRSLQRFSRPFRFRREDRHRPTRRIDRRAAVAGVETRDA